jgi:hypothetical protein
MTLEYSQQIFEKSSNLNFMKVRQVGAELFHANRRDEASSSFYQFCERS